MTRAHLQIPAIRLPTILIAILAASPNTCRDLVHPYPYGPSLAGVTLGVLLIILTAVLIWIFTIPAFRITRGPEVHFLDLMGRDQQMGPFTDLTPDVKSPAAVIPPLQFPNGKFPFFWLMNNYSPEGRQN